MGSVVQQMFPSEGVSQPLPQSELIFSSEDFFPQLSSDVNRELPNNFQFTHLEFGMLFPLAYQMHKVCANRLQQELPMLLVHPCPSLAHAHR